ncbi:hypothetical protein L1987_15540 [Smallanthus sonchifolius]|uniref:Uncharacterized protein n=1 Tax=Smallanthus sonchifolius TaxID=185202 RepID=A0ACB9J675_9ASTR|nr:hypothetical protein L1987_15540 [Smallanthus sonchifolius]
MGLGRAVAFEYAHKNYKLKREGIEHVKNPRGKECKKLDFYTFAAREEREGSSHGTRGNQNPGLTNFVSRDSGTER